MSKYIIFLLALSNWRECCGTTLRGARARDGQFPWLIQFQTIAPCGGILVSPDWVLTAAQCVQYKRNSITLYAAGLNGTGNGQTVGVKATYIFPQYQAYSATHDHDHNIALLKLVQAFDMCDDKVRLLDVAPVRLDDNYKSCLIFGWQSYVAPSTKVLAKPIQYSQVLLNSWKLCMYMLKGNTTYNNVFCTMVESDDGMKACAGNPGSPVVCEDQYQRMVLLGIASWSNFSLDCGGIPTYLGVSVFRSWMYDLIFNDKKMDEWDIGSKSSKGACGFERYLGGLSASPRSYNDTIQLDYQPPDKQFGHETAETGDKQWRPDHTLKKFRDSMGFGLSRVDVPPKLDVPLFKNHLKDYTRVSPTHGVVREPVPRFDVVKDREDNMKLYHEVGQPKDIFGRMDEVLAVPAEHGNPSYLDHPSIEKKPSKTTSHDQEADSDNLDDLDLTIPFNYEDPSRSGSLRFSVQWRNFITPCFLWMYSSRLTIL